MFRRHFNGYIVGIQSSNNLSRDITSLVGCLLLFTFYLFKHFLSICLNGEKQDEIMWNPAINVGPPTCSADTFLMNISPQTR